MKAIRALFVAMSLLTVGAQAAFASEPAKETARVEYKAEAKAEGKGPGYKLEQGKAEQAKRETAYRAERKDGKDGCAAPARSAHKRTEAQRREWQKRHAEHKGEYRGKACGKYEKGRQDRDDKK